MSIPRTGNRKKFVSTWAVVRHLPMAKVAYVVGVGAIGIGNLLIFALYKFSDRLFGAWVRAVEPAIRSMSDFLPTLRGLPAHVERTMSTQDINFLKSVVAVDWLLYVPCLLVLSLCIFLDFRRGGSGVSRAVLAELRDHNLPANWVSWPRVCGFAACSILVITFFYSGAELSGANEIYDPTWLFLLSWLFAYVGLICPSLALIYALVLLGDAGHSGQ
jgi:hypothetical protein